MKKLTQKIIFIAIFVITIISVMMHSQINNSYAYERAGFEFRKSSANGNAAGDLFGSSVAMAGKYALFGAIYNNDKGLVDSGSAYLFDIFTGKQIQKFTADNAAGDRFGSSVAIAGKYALIGSAYDDDKGLVDSGSAYLFNIFTGNQLEKF